MSNEISRKIESIVEKTQNNKLEWKRENTVTYFTIFSFYQMSIQMVNGVSGIIKYIFIIKDINNKETILFIDSLSECEYENVLKKLYDVIKKKDSDLIVEVLDLFLKNGAS